MNSSYVCIEGNIGAGKTTFAKRYAELTGATPVLEQFSENPFLESFYKNPKQYAFPLEMSFLAERFQQLNNIFSKPELFSSHYISDYTFLKTLIFAQFNLDQEELELFRNFHGLLNPILPKPDLIIYLHTETSHVQENIKNRGRSYEQDISGKYLEEIDSAYKTILLSVQNLPIVYIPYQEKQWFQLDKIISVIHKRLDNNDLKNGLQSF